MLPAAVKASAEVGNGIARGTQKVTSTGSSARKLGGKADQVYALHQADEANEELRSIQSLGISYSSAGLQPPQARAPRRANPKIYKQVATRVDNSRAVLNLSDLNVKYHALDSKYF